MISWHIKGSHFLVVPINVFEAIFITTFPYNVFIAEWSSQLMLWDNDLHFHNSIPVVNVRHTVNKNIYLKLQR